MTGAGSPCSPIFPMRPGRDLARAPVGLSGAKATSIRRDKLRARGRSFGRLRARCERAGRRPAVSVLDQLSARMGIEPEFKDATGKLRQTEPKVSRALLTAMGLAVGDAHRARTMLAQMEQAEADRPLPPVMVVRDAGAPLAVPLTLPRGIEVVRWTVTDEDGASREGEVSFAKLAPPRSRKRSPKVERRTACDPDACENRLSPTARSTRTGSALLKCG